MTRIYEPGKSYEFTSGPRFDYFHDMFAHGNAALRVPRRTLQLASGPLPPNDCHINADTVVAEVPGSTAVRGWLFLDFDNEMDNHLLVAHSVVRDQAGVLFDPTPSTAAIYPFIEHKGPEDFFAELVLQGLTRIELHVPSGQIAGHVDPRASGG